MKVLRKVKRIFPRSHRPRWEREQVYFREVLVKPEHKQQIQTLIQGVYQNL